MDGGISELAAQAGVLDTLDPAAIPNLKNVIDQGVYRNGDAAYAGSTGYYSLGITYNTKEVPQAPTSWKDLWKPEYAGAVAVPSPANSSGVPWPPWPPPCSSTARARPATPIKAARPSSARTSTWARGT
ncbi:hypothetical protein G6F65_022185 [Rhizopus arrhizus]|nr:hypothetical protein G6F65_022185 [Rhizopus arrhizus]